MRMEKDWVRGAVLGSVVGDALGVPVEFCSREKREEDPVEGMRGPSAPYYQPPGTWSDDSSMLLATVDALNTEGGSLREIMERFVLWYKEREYNPHGKLFDIGNTTSSAITEYMYGGKSLDCGMRGQGYNGNGSIMRILPASLWALQNCESRETMVEFIHRVSALTHAHPISMMACGIYTRLVEAVLRYKAEGGELGACLQEGVRLAKEDYLDLKLGDIYSDNLYGEQWDIRFRRLEDMSRFAERDDTQIKSGGFSVDTLHAAVWCLLTTDSFHDCVLKAVNLGKDTDTTATVAGGLAGLLYGEKEIPAEWLQVLARKEWVSELAEGFAATLGAE